MGHRGWRDTELWKCLVRRGQPCEALRHYLTLWLDDVETLLAKGGTAPLTFTLHDDEHSYRVAERMHELLPEQTIAKLSDLELGLLLSSAYLHDIGMNPHREIVVQIRDYLISGEGKELDPDEVRRLQRWLDEAHPGVQPPVLADKPLTEQLRRAEFLTAFFCRHRHNDWSEHFIIEKSKDIRHPPYVNWIQDLITLCKSHHFGLPRLMDPTFDLRLAGFEGELVNLRYLAALLRMADVLEFDPERTPQVVLMHRSPGPQSEIYWYKDHEISLALERGSWSIAMQARTRDAWTHRAVQETADGVDHELENCATMERQNAFLRGKKIEGDNYYVWPWPARLARTIEPLPETFVAIDGTFRPNAERILALLAGTQLYRTPLAAVRELLQNAFDAVKEQMACEMLQDADPRDRRVWEARALLHHVKLVLEENDCGELWLSCSDTGVGMTRRVIEKYLLVSGSQLRPEVLELRRETAARGIKLERSGEFGIGVLSYFMLADKMVIETRAAPGIELDQENHGWRFVTEGLDSVGELRALARTNRGTLLRLRIRNDAKDLILGQKFNDFVDDLLIKTPCVFEFRHLSATKSFGPGWAHQKADLLQRTLDVNFPEGTVDANISDPKEKKEAEANKKKLDQFRNEASSKMNLFGPVEEVLPNDMGMLRVHLPYFDLDEGPSLLFFSTIDGLIHPLTQEDDEDDLEVGRRLDSISRESWRGFSTSMAAINSSGSSRSLRYSRSSYRSRVRINLPAIVELDFVDRAKISIDRNSLEIDDENNDVGKSVRRVCLSLLETFAGYQGLSPYAGITIALLGERGVELSPELKAHSGVYWIFPTGSKEDVFMWRQIAFPAILNLDGASKDDRLVNERMEEGSPFKDEIREFDLDGTSDIEPLSILAPARILLFRRRRKFRLGLLYDAASTSKRDRRLIAEFPDEWAHIIAIEYNSSTIYNGSCPLSKRAGSDGWHQLQNIQAGSSLLSELKSLVDVDSLVDFDLFEDSAAPTSVLLSRVAKTNPETAAAFILYYSYKLDCEEWNSAKSADEQNWLAIFELAGMSSCSDFVVFWEFNSNGNDGILLRLSVEGAIKLKGHVLPGGHPTLPTPKEQWWLDSDKGRKRHR
jgi:hypothetical protein